MELKIKGLSQPVALISCPDFAADITALLRGWEIEPTEQGGGDPIITVAKTVRGYTRLSPWSDGKIAFKHRVDAACDFMVDLMRAYIRDNTDLCLHCAAVETDRGLVIFPSTYAAGKSTLAVHFAAAGARIFADDVLPLDPENNHGLASGILPRLRLPIPPETRQVLGPFLKDRRGPHSKQFQYFHLREAELAPLGTRAPIIACVLLDRQKSGPAEMGEATKAEVLKGTILRRISAKVSALDTLDRLHGIVDQAQCLTLRYAKSEEAVAALREHFSWGGAGFSKPPSEIKRAPRARVQPEAKAPASGEKLREAPYIRTPGIAHRDVDGEIFLVGRDDQTLQHLNMIGGAIWRLLDEPTSPNEVVEILQEAFPTESPQRIKADVEGVFAELARSGFITPSAAKP